jgi:hypothetical protein
LQQLDLLADHDTKSYVVGSTNSLLLQQKDRYCDILINLDEDTITISPQQLRSVLTLTVPDRRWIDFLTQTVNDTWDDANPGRPKTLGYAGSEEFIRLQFEEYILALLSAVKYRMYTESHRDDPKAVLADIEGDPASEFGNEWIKAWMKTENFRIFNKFTDSHIFDIVEPNHPCTGGLTIEDVQRRLAQQVSELHLDERFQSGKEVLGKHLATGQKKIGTAFNNLWADIEVMREAQRQRAAEQRASGSSETNQKAPNGRAGSTVKFPKAPDLSQAQASMQAAGQKAGAYLSSWGSWASEKRKTGWRSASSTTTSPPLASPPTFEAKAKSDSSSSSWTQVSVPSAEKVGVDASPALSPEKKKVPPESVSEGIGAATVGRTSLLFEQHNVEPKEIKPNEGSQKEIKTTEEASEEPKKAEETPSSKPSIEPKPASPEASPEASKAVGLGIAPSTADTETKANAPEPKKDDGFSEVSL